MSAHPMLFVVPAADAPPSGGNRYNDGLIAALGAQAARCEPAQLTPERLASCTRVWVDSLYLDQLPALRERTPSGVPLCLLAHSLPSLLHAAAGLDASQLHARERELLGLLDGALAPSRTMVGWLHERGATFPVCVVEPAREHAFSTRTPDGALRAVVVANVIPNKGVLPLLVALRRELEARSPRVSSASLRVHVIGRRETDPAYTRACERELEQSAALADCVQLVGTASYESLLGELGAAHVLLSASRVESYGMAIADARAAGCVVLARRAGHVEQLVSAQAGGELVDDDETLVRVLLSWVEDRASLAARLALAARHRLAARSWDDVASELRDALVAGSGRRQSST